MSNQFRTNRVFAMQSAAYDDLFGPREKLTRVQKIIRAILITPGILLFLLPSFRIGTQIQRPPTFEVPDKVVKGSVFTVPEDASLQTIMLGGQALPEIKSKNPALLAVAKTEPTMDLVLIYKRPTKELSLKSLLPKFEHPSFEVYSKQIAVEPAPTPAPEPTIHSKKGKAKETAAVATIYPPDANLMSKTDGLANAACWTEPKTIKIPQKPNRDWHHLPVEYANLTSMAAGEVVRVEGLKGGAKNIVVYHGGGLFSRYLELKDVLVRKGDKIQAGQELGMMSLGTWRTPIKPRWDIWLGMTEINPPSFLALSSQLCDSK